MKNVKLSVLLCSLLVLMGACASGRSTGTTASLQGEWYVIEMARTAVVPAAGQSFPFLGLDIQQANVYGNAGCNKLTGTLQTGKRSGRIRFGQLGSTLMFCPDMANEQLLLKALERVRKFRHLDAQQVAFYGKSRKPLLVLQKKTE